MEAASGRMHAEDSGRGNIAQRVLPERVLDRADADLGRQQPLDVGSTEQQCHGKNFTGPPIAFHAACPPFMYFASKPASRSAPAVWHPMWKPYTEDTDRVGLRELAGPLLDTLGVAPRGAVDDVLSARDIMLRPRVDELDALPRVDHALHFFDGQAREIAELLLHEIGKRLDLRCALVARGDALPVDVAQKVST